MAKKTTTKKKAVKKAGSKAASKRFVKAKEKGKSSMPMETRSDLGKDGMVALKRLPKGKREMALAIDALIRETVPGAVSVVKWGNACYSVGEGKQRVAFAAIMETKAGLNLALPGVGMDDPHGLLEGTGKIMRHVKFAGMERVGHEGIVGLIRQAVEIGLKGM